MPSYNCNTKKVFLARDIKFGKQLFFRDERKENQPLLISYVKTTSYLKKECKGFLDRMDDKPEESKEADPFSKKIVLRFLDVFPEELL